MKNIYINIPFCQKKCFYCYYPIYAIGKQQTNVSHFNDQIEKQYIKYLLREMELTFEFQNETSNRLLESIYIGGGTPTLLSNSGFIQIINRINSAFDGFTSGYEFTVECDPGTFDVDKVKFFRDMLNVNRLSVGVQSFDNDVLQKLNRGHNIQQTQQSLEFLQSVEYFKDLRRVSFDIIINTPFSSQQSLKSTILEILRYKPGHVTVNSLQLEEGSYFYDKKKQGTEPCPVPDIQEENYNMVQQKLTQAGYNQYEVCNYSLANDLESKHNQMYWTGDKQFYGFGMGASSLQNGQRINRPKQLKKYYEFVDYLEQNKKYPQESIEDETTEYENLKVILMSRIRSPTGIDLNELKNESAVNIYNILIKQRNIFEEYINYQALEQEYRLIVKKPLGYLKYDEVVSLLL